MSQKIKIIVSGAGGKMGRETVKAIRQTPDLELVGAVDLKMAGMDAGEVAGIGPIGVAITSDLAKTVHATRAQIVVDFTHPTSAAKNIEAALMNGAHAVVGTTGIKEADIKKLTLISAKTGKSCLIAPNFALGAVLLMQFAQNAGRYFPDVEIIELHHEKKADAPSGTALHTADVIALARKGKAAPDISKESVKGVRGGLRSGVRVHSVRLPGLVAHEEVIFGAQGQTLTLRHDTTSREAFMPGVLLAIRAAFSLKGLKVGLENLLEL